MIEPLEPAALKRRLDAGEELVLLDVREPGELAIGRLDGVRHIPLGELASRHGELDPEQPVVCICHHGLRSAGAAAFLLANDFDTVYNLVGGMERWALDVDPDMNRY